MKQVKLLVCALATLLMASFLATTMPLPASAAQPVVPTASAVKYSEAPSLADLVKAGKLPPVEQRLPANPYVVPAAETGQYGGTWRRGFLGPSEFN